ncbi:ATP-binding domain-containing protein, partial [Frankia sp. CiP3]
VGDGRVAVICPADLVEAVRAAFTTVPAGGMPGDADMLAATVVILTVTEAKGLEFDAVILVEPAAIVAASQRGLADLYVAMTRATQTLTVLHTDELPAVLHRLAADPPPSTT